MFRLLIFTAILAVVATVIILGLKFNWFKGPTRWIKFHWLKFLRNSRRLRRMRIPKLKPVAFVKKHPGVFGALAAIAIVATLILIVLQFDFSAARDQVSGSTAKKSVAIAVFFFAVTVLLASVVIWAVRKIQSLPLTSGPSGIPPTGPAPTVKKKYQGWVRLVAVCLVAGLLVYVCMEWTSIVAFMKHNGLWVVGSVGVLAVLVLVAKTASADDAKIIGKYVGIVFCYSLLAWFIMYVIGSLMHLSAAEILYPTLPWLIAVPTIAFIIWAVDIRGLTKAGHWVMAFALIAGWIAMIKANAPKQLRQMQEAAAQRARVRPAPTARAWKMFHYRYNERSGASELRESPVVGDARFLEFGNKVEISAKFPMPQGDEAIVIFRGTKNDEGRYTGSWVQSNPQSSGTWILEMLSESRFQGSIQNSSGSIRSDLWMTPTDTTTVRYVPNF